jgi:hypothetical protein
LKVLVISINIYNLVVNLTVMNEKLLWIASEKLWFRPLIFLFTIYIRALIKSSR